MVDPAVRHGAASAAHRRPRIVVLTSTFPAVIGDGTPEFVFTLAQAMHGCEITAVAPRTPGSSRRELVGGLQIVRFPYFIQRFERLAADAIMPALRAQPWLALQVPFLILAMIASAVRETRRMRADVVHAHWIAPSGAIAALMRSLGGPPYLLTIHGADAYALQGPLAGWLKRWVIGRAAAVVPVSRDIARSLCLPPEIEVHPMGVDVDALAASIGDRRPKSHHALYIGRLADKKGVDVLLHAAALVEPLSVDIIGDGPDRDRLMQLSQDLGLDGRVRFLGRQDKESVYQHLSTAACVVIPSRVATDGDQDGTPVVLAEALAGQVPVIASNLGGLGEILVDGVSGVLVPPDDVAALADALWRASSGALELESIGRAGQAAARRQLDIRSIADSYLRLVEKACG